MAKPKRYFCERDTEVDGIFIGARMPFWTESKPDADWQHIPSGVETDPATPYYPE